MTVYPTNVSDLLRSTRTHHQRQGYCKWPFVRNDGQTAHPLYTTWTVMKQRCYSCTHSKWHIYGGRGIQMCTRWYINFWHFVEDMGSRPNGYTLDRIDPNGNYCPENCRWANSYTQAINTRVPRIGNIRELPSGNFEARIGRNGYRYSRTFPTAAQAGEWLLTMNECMEY